MSDHYAYNNPASTYLYYPLAEKNQLKDLRAFLSNQLIRRFLAQKINKEVFLIKKSANLKYWISNEKKPFKFTCCSKNKNL